MTEKTEKRNGMDINSIRISKLEDHRTKEKNEENTYPEEIALSVKEKRQNKWKGNLKQYAWEGSQKHKQIRERKKRMPAVYRGS